MEKYNPYTENVPKDWDNVRPDGLVNIEFFRNAARVHFRPLNEPGEQTRGDRKAIKDQTRISRHNMAMKFKAAECEWYAMSLLTWRVDPGRERCMLAVDRLRRKWRDRWGEPLCGWVMEMQERGVPHFHLLHSHDSNFGVACRATGQTERVQRENGTWADVVRGGPDWWLRETWMDCVEAHDADSRWFCARGMIELARSKEAAARYFAKECSKREQKVLPKGYEKGLGRWWWLNPRFAPRVRHVAIGDLAFWPFDQPLANVWDIDDLMPMLRCVIARDDLDAESTAPQPAPRREWTPPRKPRKPREKTYTQLDIGLTDRAKLH